MGKGRNRKKRGGPDAIEEATFKQLVNYSWASAGTSFAAPNVQTYNILPSVNPRILAIAQLYQFYRFKRLKVTLLPSVYSSATNHGSLQACGYNPRIPNSAPSTFDDITEMSRSAVSGTNQTTPVHMIVGKEIILGDAPLKWFQSVAGTEDEEWETQGVVYFARWELNSTTNPVAQFVIEGTVEFKGRSNDGLTPFFRPYSGAPVNRPMEGVITVPTPPSAGYAEIMKDPSIPVSDRWIKLGKASTIDLSVLKNQQVTVIDGFVWIKQAPDS